MSTHKTALEVVEESLFKQKEKTSKYKEMYEVCLEQLSTIKDTDEHKELVKLKVKYDLLLDQYKQSVVVPYSTPNQISSQIFGDIKKYAYKLSYGQLKAIANLAYACSKDCKNNMPKDMEGIYKLIQDRDNNKEISDKYKAREKSNAKMVKYGRKR